uniref:Uncharacterized protein n=1 Tax=Oryza nivara TaxID=4536 RepID=A0A0E0HKV8_ORYNI
MGNKGRGLLGGFLPRPVFPISLLRQEVWLRRLRRRRGGCNRVRAGIVSSPSEDSSASASHILYRVGPFDYELAVACKSRTKAARPDEQFHQRIVTKDGRLKASELDQMGERRPVAGKRT